MQRRGPKSDTRGAGRTRLRRAPCRGGGGRDARTKAGRRRAAATRLMSERRRGCLYVLATRRPWAEVSHNFVQSRRRPARPACPKKGSRRAPARPPPYIAAPTPRYARRRRERPVGHEAEGMCLGVPTQPRRRAARAVARHTHKARAPAPLVSSLRVAATAMDSAPPHAIEAPVAAMARSCRRDATQDAIGATTRRRHTRRDKTQVHAAFDVQDTEAWSNADDLRTPSEVKAELARLRQLALACVTAKMDNKKVNDKIDLNAPKKAAVYKAPLVREAIALDVYLPIHYSSGAARRRKKNC